MKITNKNDYEKHMKTIESLMDSTDPKEIETLKSLSIACEEYEDETFFDYYGNPIIPTVERIIISAVFYKGEVVTSFRHGEALQILQRLYPDDKFDTVVCGFLTNHNRFVDRKEGYVIAKKNDQIIHDFHHNVEVNFGDEKCPPVENQLTSEDLW